MTARTILLGTLLALGLAACGARTLDETADGGTGDGGPVQLADGGGFVLGDGGGFVLADGGANDAGAGDAGTGDGGAGDAGAADGGM